MAFPVAVALNRNASREDIGRAVEHWLDTIVVPVDQNNWRQVFDLMNFAENSGWGIEFVLWAKGVQVKSVPLHKLANHPRLLGWLIQDINDPILLAMLKATTETGSAWTWREPKPFTSGVLSPFPAGNDWWAWISFEDAEELEPKIVNALLSGAEGICFSFLPSNESLKDNELLKAIGFFAVNLRLWKPLLSGRPKFSEAWEWKSEEVEGWIWSLENEESLCLFKVKSPSPTLLLKLPLVVREGVRAYAVRFPALLRLPLQRKGAFTAVKFEGTQMLNLVWLTANSERVQKLHQHTNELAPRAMQFAVQWALARYERLSQGGKKSEISEQIWSMLQEAKRRQFSRGYLTACQILHSLGALKWTVEPVQQLSAV